MWTSRRCLTIPINQAAAAVVLWALACVLMALETVLNADGALARWAILLAIGGATMTVVAVLGQSRRTVLDVVSWEARRTRDTLPTDGGPDDDRVVTLLRT